MRNKPWVLRMDPLTIIVVCVMMGGIVNLVAIDRAEKHSALEASNVTESSLCLLCWDTKTEINMDATQSSE